MFDLEKGTGASSSASIQQPTTARLSSFTDFPPTYEEHVNNNLRKFGDGEFVDVKLTDFDIEEPKPKPTPRKRKCPAWVWFVIAISILLFISALLGGLIIHYMNKHDSSNDKVSTPSAPIRPITSALTETKMVTQTSIQTRSEETTTVSPLTTTVFLTETPPTTSTQVVITTLTPSTSTALIVTVTSTSTASNIESTSSTTSTTTTAPESTTTTFNPSDVALSSSIAAEESRISSELIPSPDATTLTSITTSVSVSTVPTETPTYIPMPGGDINRCGVPGSSCNKK